MIMRSGIYKINLSGEMAYKSFLPSPLPPNPSLELDADIIALLVKANTQLGILNNISSKIPNVDLFISMYIRKEALLSSQIEGTQATLDDILDPDIGKNANQNISDVINYIKATKFAVERLKTLPLCNRFIKETHSILITDVRGQDKSPGEFRYTQNWIGPQGSDLKNAIYIPPTPEDMNETMNQFEDFINQEDNLDLLIKTALFHYQFETIHPFLDGNGRLGRLLITLFLIEKNLLQCPALYISYFLKRNRIEYYDRMMDVRQKGNYEQWIKFFLKAILESAEDAIKTIDQLTELREKNIAIISNLGRASSFALKLFSYLESSPIIDIKKTAINFGMSYNGIANAVKIFIDKGILIQTKNTSRNRNFAYADYLNILRKDT